MMHAWRVSLTTPSMAIKGVVSEIEGVTSETPKSEEAKGKKRKGHFEWKIVSSLFPNL